MANLDPDARVGRLRIAEMQLVEIAAAVRQRARVLVLDEPNSALSKRESERLFELVRQLRSEGVTVIYVSHRLQEVLDLADRITVVRDGRIVETLENDDIPEDRLIRAMVGRDLGSAKPWFLDANSQGADVVLAVKNLTAPGLDDISFEVRAGEILGIGGLPDFWQGWSRRSVVRSLRTGRPRRDRWQGPPRVRPARLDSRRNVVRAGRSTGRGRLAVDDGR